MREFPDGLLDDLSRVHGEISGLLERTRRQRERDQAPAAPTPDTAAAEPARVEVADRGE